MNEQTQPQISLRLSGPTHPVWIRKNVVVAGLEERDEFEDGGSRALPTEVEVKGTCNLDDDAQLRSEVARRTLQLEGISK